MGVHEAHLHLSYRPFGIRAIPSQTNGNVIKGADEADLPPSDTLKGPPLYSAIGL